MTNEQRLALETVAGRILTDAELATISGLWLDNRNDVQITALINAGQPGVVRSIKVEDVFDVLFASGDYMTLKMAQMQGNPLAAMAFAVLDDAKRLGPGTVNLLATATAELLGNLKGAALLSQAGDDALLARATVPPLPIHYNTVSDALNIAEGRMTL